MLDCVRRSLGTDPGASSGIGAEFARRLRRTACIWCSRRGGKNCWKNWPRNCTPAWHENRDHPGDLTDSAEPQRLCEAIAAKAFPIELLVNNAGFGWVGTIDETEQSRML